MLEPMKLHAVCGNMHAFMWHYVVHSSYTVYEESEVLCKLTNNKLRLQLVNIKQSSMTQYSYCCLPDSIQSSLHPACFCQWCGSPATCIDSYQLVTISLLQEVMLQSTSSYDCKKSSTVAGAKCMGRKVEKHMAQLRIRPMQVPAAALAGLHLLLSVLPPSQMLCSLLK